jgi:fucose permease
VPLLLLAYLGFISLGLPDGLLGVGWPRMRAEFGEPVGAVGFVLFVATGGYLLASASTGFLTSRTGVGWLLAGSTALTATALAGFGLAPELVAVVAAALLLGAGAGAIDSGLNAYAARHFSARHMNWLHASFGLGATLGPLVMTGALAAGLSWRWGYGAVALGQAGLAVAFLATTRAWRDGRPARVRRDGSPSAPVPVAPAANRTLALPAVWRGAACFAVYAGVELGAGLWAYLLLTGARGMGEAAAGVAVSGYWGSLFAGRLLVGAVADRAGVHRVLAGGVVGLVAGAALVAVPAPGWLAVAGLVLVGLAAAPVFPLLTLTTAGRVGDRHADRAIGVQIGAAALGGTALPAGIGVLVGRFSPEVLGPCLLLLALALAALYLPTRRRPSAS